MKNQVLLAAIAMAACLLCAAEGSTATTATGPDGRKIAKKIDRAKLQAALYKRTGGKLKMPGVQKGRVVYVNAQKRVPGDWLQQNAAVFAQYAKIAIDVEEGDFTFPSPKLHGNASLFVIDDEKLPTILHAPEQKWCAVNVAPLAKGAGEKRAFLAARLQKELTRGFSLLAGAQDSNYPDSLMGCVTQAEALDHFVDCRLPVDVLGRFAPYLAGYGVKPYVLATYKKACEEGWAPAPTDTVQRVIFERVKADKERGPTNPILIPPPNGKK